MTLKMPVPMAGRKRVFDSVFPATRLKDLAPTPAATPILGSAEFGQTPRDPAISSPPHGPLETSDAYPEQVIWDRAWHSATSFLTLPTQDFVVQRQQQDLDAFAAHYAKPSKNVVQSIRYVTSRQMEEPARGQKSERESIVEWYSDHVRMHFLTHSKPSLLRVSPRYYCQCYSDLVQQLHGEDAGQVLLKLRDSLDLLQSMYTYPLSKCIISQMQPFDAKLAASKFQRDLHALAAYALPQATIGDLLTRLLSDCSRRILGVGNEDLEVMVQIIPTSQDDSDIQMKADVLTGPYRPYYPLCVSMSELDEPGDILVEPDDIKETRNELLSLLRTWSRVGLGDDKARKIFASVLDKMLDEFVKWSYAGIEFDDSSVLPHLRYWVENVFARYVIQVLNALQSGGEAANGGYLSEIHQSDVQNWQDMAVTRLGALRVDELFEIVMEWDATKSRIDDLKHYITNPSTRTYLTSSFIGVLSSRLLQPGVSTLHILRLYISIIRAFRRLDPKGVLLDRVARPVRRYLRDRNDTVKVIVTGLFSDADESEGKPHPPDAEVLNELASELQEHGIENPRDDDGDIDWNNMEWVPDPIDAAPDYKKSKNFDVIGSLMSLFESKDAIVKELQTMLSDRLLENQKNFNQETTVLELLKIRLGESVLQSCSVMLRDITRESVNINQTVRREQGLEPSKSDANQDQESPQPDFHAKILSHLFWPTLQDQNFNVPTQILAQQHLYEKGFSALKQSRTLTWLNAIGQVEIELLLQDRCFKGEVTPWEASVIHAFESDPSASTTDTPISLTVSELSTTLSMAPLLVSSACKLWLSKSILVETAPDTYQVLETLSDGSSNVDPAHPAPTTNTKNPPNNAATSAAVAAAAASTAASLAASSASESVLQQKMAVYHQFILSLLTNQGAMPLPRIVMMLGMVVPGGFPFSNDELKEFLARMVRDGEVEVGGGGVYKAVPMK